jgi:hypothetical protein
MEDYKFEKSKIIPSVMHQKVPRMLTTCPSALKSILAKSNLANYNNNDLVSVDLQQHHHHSMKAVTFSVDFVKYYIGIKLKLI